MARTDWYIMPNETPFWSDGEQWTYVARRKAAGGFQLGYLRRATDIVYTDYRAGRQEVAE